MAKSATPGKELGTKLTRAGGPQFSYHGIEKVSPFAHVLFGGFHAKANVPTTNLVDSDATLNVYVKEEDIGFLGGNDFRGESSTKGRTELPFSAASCCFHRPDATTLPV